MRLLRHSAMFAIAVVASLVTSTAAPALQTTGRVVNETEIDRQTRELSSQLRCVVCQGLSLQDSPSQLAQEMRAIVREKLEEGMTQAEVKAYFVERYGEWVLLEPEPRGFNLLVYLLPVAMLFGGAAFVFARARHWTRSGTPAPVLVEDEEELV